MGRRHLDIALAAALVASVAVPAAAAGSAEVVQDGGFEAATCVGDACTSPVWAETSDFETGSFGAGPICTADAPDCSRLAPRTGTKFARFGGADNGATVSSSLQQTLTIPSGATTLTFWLDRLPSDVREGTLAVSINGTPLWTFSDDGAFASYAQASLDVSAFAGGTGVLRFAYSSPGPGGPSVAPGFAVDDISLLGPDPPGPPPPPPSLCRGQVPTIEGTDASGELLKGTPATDVIVASSGADVIRSGGGSDIVCGGDGDDQLEGGGGSDKLFGEGGKDRLKGQGTKGDLCSGGPGKDRAAGSCEKSKSA